MALTTNQKRLGAGVGLLLAGIALGVLLVFALGRQGSTEQEGTYVAVAPSPTVQIGNPDPPPPVEVPELMAFNQLFRNVAARVTPTVVFIEIEGSVEARSREFEEQHPFLPPRRQRRSAGSGVIISEDGFVVTNAHVIEGASRIRVLLNDKREFDAEVIGVDRTTDLAVIRLLDVRNQALPVVSIGDARALEVGDWVVAVGNPFRLTSTVTAGIVSALGRQVDIIDDQFRIEDFIQTDAAINPGNSGGAVVNLRGELVGIATAIATESGSYEGYGFAVPAYLMTRVVTDLIEFGDVRRGYLGVSIRAVSARDAQRLGLERIRGVYIEEIVSDGAAAQAGLREGDIVLSIDDNDIDALNQFQSAIALRRPGEAVRLGIWRRGSAREFDAQLIGRDDASFQSWAAELNRVTPPRGTPPRGVPPDQGLPEQGQPEEPSERLYDLAPWGVGLRDLSFEEAQRFGVEGGAFVVFVAPESSAAADGLPPLSVLTEIEGETVRSAVQAQALLERHARLGPTTLLRVERSDGRTAFYDVESPFYDADAF